MRLCIPGDGSAGLERGGDIIERFGCWPSSVPCVSTAEVFLKATGDPAEVISPSSSPSRYRAAGLTPRLGEGDTGALGIPLSPFDGGDSSPTSWSTSSFSCPPSAISCMPLSIEMSPASPSLDAPVWERLRLGLASGGGVAPCANELELLDDSSLLSGAHLIHSSSASHTSVLPHEESGRFISRSSEDVW